MPNEFASLMSAGREFHNLGAYDENARSPPECSRVLGTTKRPLWEDRKLRLGI